MDGFIQIVQIIINGIATGSVYALIAVGFSVIFNILKFSNFSHGALMTVSAMIGYFAVSAFKLTLLPTILIAMVAGSIVMLCVRKQEIRNYEFWNRIDGKCVRALLFNAGSLVLMALLALNMITLILPAN